MLCINKCGFYGDETKNGYCSMCYNDSSENTKHMEVKSILIKKCFKCKKKLGINGFNCKCNKIFCSKHRYSFEHSCTVDHIKNKKEEIKKNNPVVKADKFEKI